MPRRSFSTRLVSARSLAIPLALLAGACGRSAPPPPATLTAALRADATGIYPNPPIQAEGGTIELNGQIFEGLTRQDPNLRPEGALAETWSSVDERTWRFTLRPGLTFSNGHSVRPVDVVASLRAALDRPFVTRADLYSIETIAQAGDNAVEIRTRVPAPLLAAELPVGFVLPAEALAQTSVPAIGTGPYVLAAREPGRETTLRRNALFRGPAPVFESVRILVTPDARARIDALVSGRADLADQIPLESLDELAARPEIRVIARPGLRVLFLAFRVDRPPFSDRRLREAVNLALDREELNRRALLGRGLIATQLVPPTVAGFNPEIPPSRPDLAAAAKLVREAAHPGGIDVVLDGTNDRYMNDVAILSEVARQLAPAGIRVHVNAMPKAKFFPLLDAGGSAFYLLGFRCTTLDAGGALLELTHSPVAGPGRSLNTSGLADEPLDRLVDEAVATTPSTRRSALLRAALARVSDLHAFAPLVVQPESIAFSRRIEWEPPANFALRFDTMRLAPRR